MKHTIFIIEDEPDIMYVNATALTTGGFNVVQLGSGKEAMAKIKKIQGKKEEKPALVLLDLVLPDINGLEILRALRENKVTQDVKVFIFSNYTSDALLNIQYIKPDKFILKSATTPSQLVEIVKEGVE